MKHQVHFIFGTTLLGAVICAFLLSTANPVNDTLYKSLQNLDVMVDRLPGLEDDSSNGRGPITRSIEKWKASVTHAGGVTIDIEKHVSVIENLLPSLKVKAAEVAARNCSCPDPKSCPQLTTYPAAELFGYGANHWDKYLTLSPQPTTIVVGAYWVSSSSEWSHELMCAAHKKGTRVLLSSPTGLGNAIVNFSDVAGVTSWIETIVLWVAEHSADGFVMDKENEFSPLRYSSAEGLDYSALVALVTATLQAVRPGSVTSVALPWSPDGIDRRYYDWRGIGYGCTYSFIMGYSVDSQILNRCIATGQSVKELKKGIQDFIAWGVPADRLILGTDWGGQEWKCINYDGTNADLDYCEVEVQSSSYRGVNCTSASATSCSNLDDCWDLLKSANATTARRYDSYVDSPYFNYLASAGDLRQVWYEDQESLAKKYRMAKNEGIRGVGPWEYPKLNYSHPKDVREIWSTFCEFFDC